MECRGGGLGAWPGGLEIWVILLIARSWSIDRRVLLRLLNYRLRSINRHHIRVIENYWRISGKIGPVRRHRTQSVVTQRKPPTEQATEHQTIPYHTSTALQPRQKTYPLLSELTSALVLSVSQKFDDTALVGGKTDDLAGDLTDEGSAAGRLALAAADLVLGGVEGRGFLVMLVSRIRENLIRVLRIMFELENWSNR